MLVHNWQFTGACKTTKTEKGMIFGMAEHPIQGLMTTAMESIKDMVDVNTIVGDAVQSPDGTVIIPISKVTFGFAAGGSEFKGEFVEDGEDGEDSEEVERESTGGRLPFGGGSGAGVSISPIAFLVVNKENIKLLPVNFNTSLDKVLEFIPDIVEKLSETIKRKITVRKETKQGDCSKKKEMEVEE